jgi:hypothetical protein
MDHDPSRNVPHFWRHENTTFSSFIKSRERPHRRGRSKREWTERDSERVKRKGD